MPTDITNPSLINKTYSKYIKSNFSVLYFNSRSLLPKIDYLRTITAVHAPNCMCVVETWLNADILNNELCIEGYDIICLDCNRHGGGILIYVNSTYSHNILYSGSLELKLIIVSIYATVPIIIALFIGFPILMILLITF